MNFQINLKKRLTQLAVYAFGVGIWTQAVFASQTDFGVEVYLCESVELNDEGDKEVTLLPVIDFTSIVNMEDDLPPAPIAIEKDGVKLSGDIELSGDTYASMSILFESAEGERYGGVFSFSAVDESESFARSGICDSPNDVGKYLLEFWEMPRL